MRDLRARANEPSNKRQATRILVQRSKHPRKVEALVLFSCLLRLCSSSMLQELSALDATFQNQTYRILNIEGDPRKMTCMLPPLTPCPTSLPQPPGKSAKTNWSRTDLGSGR